MAKDPHAPPANERDQFEEVARLLGVALHRWHKLHRAKTSKPAPPVEEERRVQHLCTSADDVVISAEPLYPPDSRR